MKDETITTGDLLTAWRDATRAAELADRLAQLALDASEQADRQALASDDIAVLAEAAAAASASAAVRARSAATQASAYATEARDGRLAADDDTVRRARIEGEARERYSAG